MANHARIVKNKLPITVAGVDMIVDRIISDRFGDVLSVTKNSETEWLISVYGDNTYEGILFWINEVGELEFRHGHGFIHFWYLEGVFRENLAVFFGGDVNDDGVGEDEIPRPEKYENFDAYFSKLPKKYLKSIYKDYLQLYSKEIYEKLEVPEWLR
jgi:hypothetical protein